ncbi:MAG TPA: hypothetical protein VEC16_06595 [Alphaproteobacteria bacterium]|nr:hypothetical protein [Alphaproteobacteria bacterium]
MKKIYAALSLVLLGGCSPIYTTSYSDYKVIKGTIVDEKGDLYKIKIERIYENRHSSGKDAFRVGVKSIDHIFYPKDSFAIAQELDSVEVIYRDRYSENIKVANLSGTIKFKKKMNGIDIYSVSEKETTFGKYIKANKKEDF